MLPTLWPGDRVFTHLHAFESRDPLRWEVVVFQLALDEHGQSIPIDLAPDWPRMFFIGRVVGLPGDSVAIRDSALVVNGEPVEEHPALVPPPPSMRGPLLRTSVRRDGAEFDLVRANEVPETDLETILVPEGRLLILGDFRNNARDGRVYGTTPRESLVASVSTIYFSMALDSWDFRSERVGIHANAWIDTADGD